MSDFDAVVIGAGCAGSVAAYTLARAGKSVLVVERGEFAGAKNMTGGRIYTHSLKKVFPDFVREAPLERKVSHERIALMTSTSNMTIDFTSKELGEASQESYTVLRARFDRWLAEKAETAGAEIIYGIAVEEILKDDSGRVIGIKAGDDEITADLTIVAEGANSLLSERYLDAKTPRGREMAVGVKEVFELSPEQIEDRFLLREGEGAAMLFVGDCTKGKVGGGFLYTNQESISLGLVLTIDQDEITTPVYQMLEDFKSHPSVAPVIRDARMIEHSGHMVPEGGYDMVPEMVYNGALIIGDAAMLCMNLGYQVRGMDLAVESGRLAGEAAIEALEKGDTSKEGLSLYKTKLSESFVLRDLKTFKDWPHTMESWDRMFVEYPNTVKNIFNELFVVDGAPQKPLRKRIMPIVKRMGLIKTLREVRGALKSL